MDYWLSKDAMKLLADKVGEYVLAPGVFPPIAGIDKAKVIPIRELSDEGDRPSGATSSRRSFSRSYQWKYASRG